MAKIQAFWVGVILCLLAPAFGRAQAKAGASIDPATLETGDTFNLRILVSGVSAAPASVDFSNWAPWIPADQKLSQSEWSRSGTQWVRRYTFIVFDSAHLHLPPVSITTHLGDKLETNPLSLTVVETPAGSEMEDLEDIRDIRREAVSWVDYWPLGAGLLLALLVWLFFRRKKPKTLQPVHTEQIAPTIPPAAVALEKLQQLARSKPWQRGQTLEFYAQISLILREYIELQFKIPALESTTKEIIASLPATNFPAILLLSLESSLNRADLVKFADQSPAEKIHEQALQEAQTIVNQSAI